MKNKYPHIFEPITVRRMTVKNRIVMTPMGTNYGEQDRYKEFAAFVRKKTEGGFHITKDAGVFIARK